jgi:hypothetical protein
VTHSATLLALDGLAVFRLTRLLISDTITAPVRERLYGRRPGVTRDMGGERIMVAARPRLAEFLSCPWCVSPWLAAAVTACQALAPAVWLYPSCVLAFSAMAGLLSEHQA